MTFRQDGGYKIWGGNCLLCLNGSYAPDKPGGKWYKSQPVGINIIRKFMSRIATKAELSGRKTNHSARKTTVEKLCRSNIPDSMVMQVTGHKNVQSLNAYKKPS